MFEIERDFLVEILKEFNRTGITPEALGDKLYPYCCSKTIRNYLNGYTKPKKSKFNIILSCLQKEFPQEYKIIKNRILEKNGVSCVADLIIKRLNEQDTF